MPTVWQHWYKDFAFGVNFLIVMVSGVGEVSLGLKGTEHLGVDFMWGKSHALPQISYAYAQLPLLGVGWSFTINPLCFP